MINPGEIFGNTRVIRFLEKWGNENRYLVVCLNCKCEMKILAGSLKRREAQKRTTCPKCKKLKETPRPIKKLPDYGLPEIGRLFLAGKLSSTNQEL